MFNVLVVHMCSVRQSHTKSLILFLLVFWEILYSHGLFIRYTFLVPGWTRFFFQDCSKSQWHRNNGERMWSMLSWQHHTVIDLSSYRSPISLRWRCAIDLRSGAEQWTRRHVWFGMTGDSTTVKTHRSSHCFSSRLWSNFCDPFKADVSFPLVVPDVVVCCCSPSASGLNVLNV